MLCSRGFILQLRRSPAPCCVGNGTLVTRVRRVPLTWERRAAQGSGIKPSSSLLILLVANFPSCNSGVSGKRSVSGRILRGPRRAGRRVARADGRASDVGASGEPPSRRCGVPVRPSRLPGRGGRDVSGVRRAALILLTRVWCLAGARRRRARARPAVRRASWASNCCEITLWTAERGDQPRRPLFSALSGFYPAMDLLSSAPDDSADTPVRK